MGYGEKLSRKRTTFENQIIRKIESQLVNEADEKVLLYLEIKCATEDGFFEKMFKNAFRGLQSAYSKSIERESTLANALYAAERCISKQKKKQKSFKEGIKDQIYRGLKVARSFLRIDHVLEEYEDEEK